MAQELKPDVNLPAIITNLAIKLEGDFCWSKSFDVDFICRLVYEGFLCMAHREMGRTLLLPKLHASRCALEFSNLREPKRIRQLCAGFAISFNRDFEGVIKGCNRQHSQSWLYPALVDAFRAIRAFDFDIC